MSIYEKLYDWQKTLVDKYKDRSAYGLFLDMGLGKTPISLAFVEQNECTKLIIVSIKSKAIESEAISGSWRNWLKSSAIPYTIYDKTQTRFDQNGKDCIIINYSSLFERKTDDPKKSQVRIRESLLSFIKSCRGQKVGIILDESHNVKNSQSMQTKAVMIIQSKLKINNAAVFTYLLSGTPFTSGYIDLHAQLKLLGCDYTKSQFIDEFCERGHVNGLLAWQQPIVGYKNVNKLFDLVHKYAVTIDSKDVVNLPDQVFVNHISNESSDFTMFLREKAYAKDILETAKRHQVDVDVESRKGRQVNPFFRNIAYPDLKWLAETAGSFWMRCRQLSIGFQGNAEECIWYDRTRLNQLKAFLQDNEDNYVLFYNYTPELLEIYQICEDLGYNIDVYSGEVKSLYFYDQYSSQSKEKQLTNKKNIIISNFASGATGMNWQLYNKCILFSLPTYDDYRQGLKRVHRLGQQSTVIYHMFYQQNWLDLSMKESLDKRTQYTEDLFADQILNFLNENNDF